MTKDTQAAECTVPGIFDWWGLTKKYGFVVKRPDPDHVWRMFLQLPLTSVFAAWHADLN